MAIAYEKLFKVFSANLKKSHPAQEYLQRHGLLPNIGIGYNAQGWDQLQQCIIFPLRRQHDKIVGFYGLPITEKSSRTSAQWFVPRRQGFYPRYPDPYTERLLLTGSILEAALLWQLHPVWESYTVLACYSPGGLTKEQRVAIASLRSLREVVLYFEGKVTEVDRHPVDRHPEANQVLARIIQQLQPPLLGVKISKVDVPPGGSPPGEASPGETISSLDAGARLHLLDQRTAYAPAYETKSPERRGVAETTPTAAAPASSAMASKDFPETVADRHRVVPHPVGHYPVVADPGLGKEDKKVARPRLDVVTLAWIDQQENHYGISDYELSLQVGQVRNYLYQIRSGKMRMSRGVKAAVWHFFKLLEDR